MRRGGGDRNGGTYWYVHMRMYVAGTGSRVYMFTEVLPPNVVDEMRGALALYSLLSVLRVGWRAYSISVLCGTLHRDERPFVSEVFYRS